MEILLCLLIGYLLGCLSPAALFSKLKGTDLRSKGTGNLGATNAMLILGKGYGVLVMVLDVAKAYLAYRLAEFFFPRLGIAGLLAGGGAVIGHIFPFYMRFRGGKGLATYAGTILAYDPKLFLLLFITAVILMVVINYTVAVHIYAAAAFPLLVGFDSRSLAPTLVAAAIGILLLHENWFIIDRIRRGDDVKVRDFLRGK